MPSLLWKEKYANKSAHKDTKIHDIALQVTGLITSDQTCMYLGSQPKMRSLEGKMRHPRPPGCSMGVWTDLEHELAEGAVIIIILIRPRLYYCCLLPDAAVASLK